MFSTRSSCWHICQCGSCMLHPPRYAADGSYGRSFPHFLVAASLTKDTFREQQGEQFLRVTHCLTERLTRAGKRDKVEEVYLQAIDCMRHPELLTNFGSFLFLGGQTQRAEELFREALREEPAFLLARDRLENLASSLLPRWHFPCSMIGGGTLPTAPPWPTTWAGRGAEWWWMSGRELASLV